MNVMMRYMRYVCRKRGIQIDNFYRIQISKRHIILVGNRTEEMLATYGGDDILVTRYMNIYLR
jgi:hypothetical protein